MEVKDLVLDIIKNGDILNQIVTAKIEQVIGNFKEVLIKVEVENIYWLMFGTFKEDVKVIYYIYSEVGLFIVNLVFHFN